MNTPSRLVLGIASFLVLQFVTGPTHAQTAAPDAGNLVPPPVVVADDDQLAQNQPPAGTLPPVEVRPPEQPLAIEPAYGDGPVEFGTEQSFPPLSEQILGGAPLDPGGLNSAFRGEKSLFDQSNLSTIVDRELLREKMAPDMLRALQYEVGVLVQATARGQASVFLHGVTGQQVLILIDGVRMNNTVLRAGPNQYFNTVDPGQVERIEVIRGAGSVLYGSDAIGGVINIVTRGANPFIGDYSAGTARQYFSTADTGSYTRANVEGWVGGQGLFAGASYMNVNDLDIGGGLPRQPFTSYDQYAGDIKYNLLVGENQMVTVALQHFEQQDLPRSDRFDPFVENRVANSARPTFFDVQQRDLAYIRWQGLPYNENPFFDVFSATFSYSKTKEAQTETRPGTLTDRGQFTDDMVGATVALARDRRDEGLGVLTYGVDYYYEDVDSSRTRERPLGGVPFTILPQYPDDALSDRAGAYAQWDVPVTMRLNAVAGVRYENTDVQGTPTFILVNPAPPNPVPPELGPGDVATPTFFARTYQAWVASIGLTYALDDRWNLVGGVYEGYRSPTLDDLTVASTFQQNQPQFPDPNNLSLRPEHSITYEIGTKYNGDRLRLQVMEWWMTIDDYIARNVEGANTVLRNKDAYLNGTEIAGEYLLDGGWAAYGNFAYTFGRETNPVSGVSQPVSRIPPTQGVLGLRWRASDNSSYFDLFTWMANRVEANRYNSANLTDSRFFLNNVPVTPGYATLNIRAGRTFGQCQNHRVSIILENITDQYYRVLGSGVDGTGASAIFGYEFVQ